MRNNKESLNLSKYLYLKKVISFDKNQKLFDYYDELLIKKRFNNAYELSVAENILNIETFNLTPKIINEIINNFIISVKKKKSVQNRNLYEIVQLSNISASKINKSISDDKLLNIGNNLYNVSCETNYINVDFIILRALDNFITKMKNPILKNKFNAIRKDIIRKILNFKYVIEIKESKITHLYWIDRILNAVMKQEISVANFITLNKKLFQLIPDDLDVYYKILHAVNYLSFQPSYDDLPVLRKFKRFIIKQIDQKYKIQKYTQKKTEELMIRVLAWQYTCKEDYYYLFDVISFLNNESHRNKKYCLNLCEYLIYISNKQNIFCYRFIRQAFINLINKLIEDDDAFEIKEEEFRILAIMLHNDSFFYLNREELFEKMVILLGKINLFKNDCSRQKFYKYCDILDYILANNKDIKHPDIIENISINEDEKNKIYKRFQLSLAV